jgi:DNA-directed RNA polymerase subunit RPC12/RpoP
MRCARCGEEVLLGAERCGNCGAPLDLLEAEPENAAPLAESAIFEKPLFSAPGAPGPPVPEVLPWSVHEDENPKTAVSLAGGALILVGGFISMLYGLVVLNVPGYAPQLFGVGTLSQTPLYGIVVLLCGLGAVIGGVLGLFRKLWGFVMAASILCVISMGWFYVSIFLGLIGLMLVAMTKDEFD